MRDILLRLSKPEAWVHLGRLLAPGLMAALVAACGGGSTGVGGDNGQAPATLSGTVAVGAPMTGGRLRNLDATGTVIASDVQVDSQGRYSGVTLSGTGPWRIEACGHAGDQFTCLYSIVQQAGTGHVTPLTSAMSLLATSKSVEDLMSGQLSPDASALSGAQNTLRQGLASLLADAGLDATSDLVTGTLNAGSRTGYDRLLDAVGVSLGTDDKPFVQISPRLGSGNLFLQPGQQAVGQIALAPQAGQLPLQGVETLFSQMSQAMTDAQACTSPTTGLATLMSSDASLSMDDGEPPVTGPQAVGAALCEMLAGADGERSRFGMKLISPTLGRCDFSGTHPICAVSFALQSPEGDVEALGDDMSLSYQAGAWKFRGDLLPVRITANGAVQRDRRIDGPTPVVNYSRALVFEIAARSGLACARVSQSSADGTPVVLAYYKLHGTGSPSRLSVWREAGNFSGDSLSLNPAAGHTRDGDDAWIHLPDSDAGDTAIRNFLRGGRSVTVDLYSNSNCSTALAVGGRNSFTIPVRGVPPVWAQLPSIPWATLTDPSVAALRSFTAAAGVGTNHSSSWTFPRGRIGLNGASFCSQRETCGEGGSGRVGEAAIGPRSSSLTMSINASGAAIAADNFKMLALYGRAHDGLGVQSNHLSCPSITAGRTCDGN
jgi:hypothetical protein